MVFSLTMSGFIFLTLFFHLTATIETEKNLFKKQIDILDKQIDQLVYQLYELTPEEIPHLGKAS